MTDTAVVVGDVHLGSPHANVDAFDDFLDGVYRDRESVGEVVLLGDLWDLVRRDPFGCAWETSETVTRVKRLAAALPVRYVLGNHDAYLRHLDRSLYDVELCDEHVVDHGEHRIRCCHGNAFDALQADAVSNYLSGPGDRGTLDPTDGRKDRVVAAARDRVQDAKRRLRVLTTGAKTNGDVPGPFPRRERRAHAFLERIPEDKLVYGHTHAPYVHPANVAANPGSWKATAPVHNTYLRIEDGDIGLFRHRGSAADERLA